MQDFQILSFEKHGAYFVATVQSYRDQEIYTVHNRWGSWMVGDHTKKGAPMREAATISRNLAPILADQRKTAQDRIDKLAKSNPFLAQNPFMAGATT